jgi:methionine-rich copper-binding protein CopC
VITTTARRLGQGLAALAVIVVVSGLGVAPASAHSQLTSTTPADGTVLDVPPPEVRFTFDAPLLQDTDTISINDANGNVVKSIHPTPEGDSVAIPWPEGTTPGDYQVAYRVVCGDGHPVIGAINLTVKGSAPAAGAATASAAAAGTTSPAPTAAATPVAASDAPASSSGSAMPLIIGAAVLAAAVVALIVALVARRRGTPVA